MIGIYIGTAFYIKQSDVYFYMALAFSMGMIFAKYLISVNENSLPFSKQFKKVGK